MANWLSLCMQIADTSLCHIGISSKKCRSYFASSPVLSKAINSDFIVDLAMQVCLDDFQDTAALPNVNTWPLVDLESFVSKIQFALLYLSNTERYLV